MKLLLAILNALPDKSRQCVEGLADLLISSILAVIAGGLESIASPLAIHVPLCCMAAVVYAGAAAMLYLGAKSLLKLGRQSS